MSLRRSAADYFIIRRLNMKVAVVGSGAWGTALALLLTKNGNDVTLWSFYEKETATMKETGENPFLKGVAIDERL